MKIVYNVTVIIDHSVHDKWIAWMKDVHIPDVMATGFFDSYQIQKILEANNPDGVTYAIQYVLPSLSAYNQYQEKDAPRLQKDHTEKFKGKFGAFRTLMELVDRG